MQAGCKIRLLLSGLTVPQASELHEIWEHGLVLGNVYSGGFHESRRESLLDIAL